MYYVAPPCIMLHLKHILCSVSTRHSKRGFSGVVICARALRRGAACHRARFRPPSASPLASWPWRIWVFPTCVARISGTFDKTPHVPACKARQPAREALGGACPSPSRAPSSSCRSPSCGCSLASNSCDWLLTRDTFVGFLTETQD